MTKKHIILILALSLVSTLLIQWNLTRAILFDDYLQKPNITYENNDESYYLSLISESAKGHGTIGNPFLKEWSGERYLYVPLNVWLIGSLQRVFHLDVKGISILFDYVAVYILMVMVFVLFVSVFRYNVFGYLAAGAYIFLPRMFDMWKRPISPQVNFIPLFLFFSFYFSKISFWKREAALAFSAGAMFYTYPYHWTFALVLLGLSDTWAFYQDKKISIKYFYKYAGIAAMSAGYIANFLSIYHLSYYAESMGRIGALASRMPAGYYTQAMIIGLLTAYFVLRWFGRTKYALEHSDIDLDKIVLGLFAGIVVLNQQIATNMQLEFNTHYLPVILLFMALFVSSLLFTLRQHAIGKNKNIVLAFSAGFVVSLMFSSVRNEAREYPALFSEKSIPGSFMVYDWFRQNHITDEVIYAPDELADDIPMYTGNYVVFSELARLQLMSTSDLLGRFVYFDITNKTITDDPMARQRDVFGIFYTAQMQKDAVIARIGALLTRRPAVPKDMADYVPQYFNDTRAIRQRVSAQDLEKYLDTYHATYIVYRLQDRDMIYKKIRGDIVYESAEYIIKKR